MKEGSRSKLGEGDEIAERRLSVPGESGGMSKPGDSKESDPKRSGDAEDLGSSTINEIAG